MPPQAQYADTENLRTISAEVIGPDLFRDTNRLFQIYFRYIHPIWPLLYKPLYDSLDHEQILEIIPRSLLFAILSLAVLIERAEHESNPVAKHEQAQQYFNEALEALKHSDTSTGPKSSLMDVKPSILHCQVFTILALQQHSIGDFSQAGIFCAVAASMAIDQSLYRISNPDNHVETQVRSRLWWTIYVLEKMLSCEMSRPVLLRAEEAETPLPSVEESDEYELYQENPEVHIIANHGKSRLLRCRTMSAFHTSIGIAKIMENVSRDIYSMAARQRIRQDRDSGEVIRLRLWDELENYETSMENSPLKLDTSGRSESPPVILTNYVFMWLTTILVHRPFIENWQSSQRDTSRNQRHPADICLNAANKICSTLNIYTRYMSGLPCDMIFPIFVAANILLRHWRQLGHVDVHIKSRLELCLKWLQGLGKNWKSAETRQQMLSDSISSTLETSQISGEDTSIEESNGLLETYSSLEMLAMDNSFDLEYLNWVNSLDIQTLVE